MDFNKIETTYYGPPSQYQYDLLYLNQKDQTPELVKEFEIKLEICLFSYKMLNSTKRMKIVFNRRKEYFPTFHNSQDHTYFVDKNVMLSYNPYHFGLIVKLSKHKNENWPALDSSPIFYYFLII